MTEFAQATNVITENGEIVGKQDSPIIQVKKLNGQGSLYKLTDANYESINSQRESKSSPINVDKFIRSVRSNFGAGHHNVSAIGYMPLPDQLRELGAIRIELNSKVMITPTQHHFDEVSNYSLFIDMMDEAVFSIDSWYGIIKKAHDDGEVGDDFMELCTMVVEQVPEQVSHFFDDTMFDEHLDFYVKMTVMRERVYEEND